jgi:putative peptidoglycan lipid II flippase
MTTTSTIKKISIASIIMMSSVFASRVIGVFREMTIAGIGGVRSSVDAYQVAFVIPEILNHVVATGFLSITFIPIFSRYLLQKRDKDGWRTFSLILNTFGAVLLVLIAISLLFAPHLVNLIVPGIDDQATFNMAVKMTRIIIPAQFFFFAGGLLMAVQFANEKFLIPALAPLIYNLMIIAGGVLLSPYLGMEGFAWGVLAGAFAGNFALQLWGASRLGMIYSPVAGITHPDVVAYIKLTLPLMVGLTLTFSTEILSKFFGSYLPAGSIAALNYALRVMFILVGLFGQAVGAASYPYLARLAAQNDMQGLNTVINTTLKFIFLVLPVSAFFIVGKQEIIFLLFQRGAFTADATTLTASILPYFMIGAFAFAAQNIVSRGYYAMQNTLSPTLLSTLSVVISFPVIFVLMKHFGVRGVALGLSLSAGLQCLVLFEFWSRKSGNTARRSVYIFLIKMIPVSCFTGIPIWFTAIPLQQMESSRPFLGALFILCVLFMEWICLFYTAGVIFKVQEIHTLFARVIERMPPWKRKSA